MAKRHMQVGALFGVMPVEQRKRLESRADLPYRRKQSMTEPTTEDLPPRTAIQYVSTRTLDRDDEILDPAGADLEEFRRSPAVLWAHDWTSPPIGKDLQIESDDFGLKATTEYARTERAEEVWALKQGGFLNVHSVGYIVHEYKAPGENDWPDVVDQYAERWGMKSSDFANVQRLITRWELLEHSDVPIASNRDAFTEAVAKGLTLSDDMAAALGVRSSAPDAPPAEPKRIIVPVRAVRAVRRVAPVRRVIPRSVVDVRRLTREELDRMRGRL